jgi:hypothetical protein
MRKDAILFLVLIAVFAAVRLWGLADYCLDCDEIWSLTFARSDWGRLLAAVAEDVSHPPLFYLLLKGWIALGGESVIWLRLFPALTAIACVVPLVLFCRSLRFSWAESNLALALLTVNAFLIEYAQLLRMFDLLQFFALCSLWRFVRFTDGPPGRWDLAGLTIGNILLVYSHYWGWVVVGTEGLYLLLCRRDKVRPFAVGVLMTMACFVPWVMAVARAAMRHGSAVRQIQWIGVPGWADMARFYARLTGGFPLEGSTVIGMALFGVPVTFWALRLIRVRGVDGPAFVLLALLTIVPPLVTFVASRLLPQSVWAERQLTFVAAPFAVFVAAAVMRLPQPAVRVVPAACVVWAMAAGAVTVREATAKVSWDRLAADMVNAEPGDGPVTIYASDAHVADCLRFHLDEAGAARFRVVIDDDPTGRRDERFWIAYREKFAGRDLPMRRFNQYDGYIVGEVRRSSTPWQNVAVAAVRRIGGGEEADKPAEKEP